MISNHGIATASINWPSWLLLPNVTTAACRRMSGSSIDYASVSSGGDAGILTASTDADTAWVASRFDVRAIT